MKRGRDFVAKKLLCIIANPKTDVNRSKGLQIKEAYLEAFKEVQPDIEIETLDLFRMGEDENPEIDTDLLYARAGLSFMGKKLEDLTEDQQRKYKAHVACAEKFMAADYYVFVSPIWNLGAPHIMKKYIDNLFIAGKTFSATPDNRHGLLSGHVQHLQTRGGIYSEGPLKELESSDRYLTIAMKFLGLTVHPVIYAEGLDHNPKQAPEIVAQTIEQAKIAARELAKL